MTTSWNKIIEAIEASEIEADDTSDLPPEFRTRWDNIILMHVGPEPIGSPWAFDQYHADLNSEGRYPNL